MAGTSQGAAVSAQRGPAASSSSEPLLLIAAMTAVYWLLPVPGRMHKASWELLFWCGLAVLGSLIRAGHPAGYCGLARGPGCAG